MPDVSVVADNICSPIGINTAENFDQLKKGISGIQQHHDEKLSHAPFYASLFKKNAPANAFGDKQYSKFERLLIASITNALNNCDINPSAQDTVLIISSTKGNISMLEEAGIPGLQERIAIPHSAKLIARHFGFVNNPVVICNACISGIVAMITGMRLIKSGRYQNAVIAGADEVSRFVLSGFQSFQAVSSEPCKPFDADRTGITLGEGAATIILSSRERYKNNIRIKGGAVSNDANHISAPSRTGEELRQAISRTLIEAGVTAKDIDFISAHGTATLYNDEMEAKAISLSGLGRTPLNSLKGFYGHTLGAAGLIESIISMQSMREDMLLPTLGYNEPGTSNRLNICERMESKTLNTCLKTASGFGGCNAALLFAKS